MWGEGGDASDYGGSGNLSRHTQQHRVLHVSHVPPESIPCGFEMLSWVFGVWGRQFERQYIFVAATLPSEGKKSTASSLQKMFPDLVWLAGRRLHQGLSTVAWTWRETTQDTWRSTLQVHLL